jgi:putative heme-binding domain-containing protein
VRKNCGKNFTLLIALVLTSLDDPTAHAQGYRPNVAAGKMTVADGLTVKLFAGEPEVRQPILVKCDDRGRLWTIQYLQYPNPAGLKRVKVDRWSRTVYDRIPAPPPKGPKGADLITILEDADGDGKADTLKNFVSGLNLTTGLAFGHEGVFVMQVPYLLFYPDRNRDDIPDGDPHVLLSGFGMEDAQSLANHLTWGPDGWLYGVNGSTTTCHVRGIEFQQGCWRYHPLTKEFELFSEGGGNTYGLTFDENGNLFYSTNGGPFVHAVQGGYFYKSFGKHGPLHNLFAYGFFAPLKSDQVPGGPPTGGTIYLGDSFPEKYRGKFIAGNFLGHTASWWSIKPVGTTVKAQFGGVLLNARDTWFGPTDLCVGPDGAIYVCDFHDKRTAHPDPDANWDRSNGRIYKIAARETKPITELDLHTLSSPELVMLLRHFNRWFGDRARVLLAQRRDRSVVPMLEKLAFQHRDGNLALQGLWALHVTAGLDDETARKLLSHPYEYVRSWTVRLLGDRKKVSPAMARRLLSLAETEPSHIVRNQLACTAKRLPGQDGLPIVVAILNRDIDNDDPRIPWLLWWAIEDKAISDTKLVLKHFAVPGAWQKESYRDNIRRLMRRYAANGTAAGYRACSTLLESTPPKQLGSLHAALAKGLSERSTGLHGLGHGGLYSKFSTVENSPTKQTTRKFQPLTPELRDYIANLWNLRRSDRFWNQLAIQAGVSAVYDHVLKSVSDPAADTSSRTAMLGLLEEFGKADCVPVVLPFVDPKQPEQVQSRAMSVLNRFGPKEFTDRLLANYPKLSPKLRSQARDVLFSRPLTAGIFLKQVDQKRFDAREVPLDQLRRIALHEDKRLNALVRKHWGNIQGGTPEEKLATMRRFNNDLRAGSSNRQHGKELYRKHCGICHQLFGEGNKIGPELTKANRSDRAALLRTIVDPSAVIRKEFLSYVVVTTSGRVITGLIAEQDAASLTLLDAKNNRTKISRDDIEILKESPISLMPEKILQPLKPQELRDLFQYLQSDAT